MDAYIFMRVHVRGINFEWKLKYPGSKQITLN